MPPAIKPAGRPPLDLMGVLNLARFHDLFEIAAPIHFLAVRQDPKDRTAAAFASSPTEDLLAEAALDTSHKWRPTTASCRLDRSLTSVIGEGDGIAMAAIGNSSMVGAVVEDVVVETR
jgi:hypothetical protein